MIVKVLGTGCVKCKTLTQNVEKAAERLSLPIQIEKVTDILEIMRYGVISTPALVVDDVVRSHGRVLDAGEVTEILKSAYGH